MRIRDSGKKDRKAFKKQMLLPDEKISIGPGGLIRVPGEAEDKSLQPSGLHGCGNVLRKYKKIF